MEELIMRWKVMKLDLQRQVGLLMEGRLTTGTNNRDSHLFKRARVVGGRNRDGYGLA